MIPNFVDTQLLCQRHPETWDLLYTSTCRRTFRVLGLVTGAAPAILEELNQDVWLSAIECIDGFDATRGTAQEWILGIARLKGLHYLRKKYKQRLAYVGSYTDLVDPTESGEDIEAAERAALLRGAIESLPESWQLVLRQKYSDGLTVKQIAELCETTPKAIESTLSRARQRLRELFQSTIRQLAEQ